MVLCSSVDSGGTVVLVSQDGIQRPPLRFPRGGHLLQFLTCLETGLLPHGQLDPPLWSQRGKVRRLFLFFPISVIVFAFIYSDEQVVYVDRTAKDQGSESTLF